MAKATFGYRPQLSPHSLPFLWLCAHLSPCSKGRKRAGTPLKENSMCACSPAVTWLGYASWSLTNLKALESGFARITFGLGSGHQEHEGFMEWRCPGVPGHLKLLLPPPCGGGGHRPLASQTDGDFHSELLATALSFTVLVRRQRQRNRVKKRWSSWGNMK